MQNQMPYQMHHQMQHHLYTFDTQRQDWEISLVSEAALLGLAYRGQISNESLLYNPDTGNFTSAWEHALLLGNARGLDINCGDTLSARSSARPGDSATSFDKISYVEKPLSLPRVPPHFAGPSAPQGTRVPPSSLTPPVHHDKNVLLSPPSSPPTLSTSARSLTDDAVERYVPKFQNSVRLQIVGLMMLPVFGLGLPLLMEGWRRSTAVLRLVEQTGMEKGVWLSYVGQRSGGVLTQPKTLRAAYAGLSAVVAVAAAGEVSRASVRTQIIQLASSLKDAAPTSAGHRNSARSRPSAARAKVERDLELGSVGEAPHMSWLQIGKGK